MSCRLMSLLTSDGMGSVPRWLLLFGASSWLLGQGWDATLGVGIQQRKAVPVGPASVGGSNQSPAILRLNWDHRAWLANSGLVRGQWTVALSTAHNLECDEQALALGYQRIYWNQGPLRVHGGLGAELRGSRRMGKDFAAWYTVPTTPPWTPWNPPGASYGASLPVLLGGAAVWEVRPVLRAFAGLRGIWFPVPGGSFLWGRQPGAVHSLTRLEVALPLGKQGGTGPKGMLRNLAPGPELTFSWGVRFNAPL